MKPIYYYDSHIMSFNEEDVRDYLAQLQLSKNDIDNNTMVLHDFEDLKSYCIEYGYEMKDLEMNFNIDLKEWFND